MLETVGTYFGVDRNCNFTPLMKYTYIHNNNIISNKNIAYISTTGFGIYKVKSGAPCKKAYCSTQMSPPPCMHDPNASVISEKCI